MDNFPYQMISNLRPQTTLAWRLKVRVTRMWRNIDRYAQTAALNMIFVDELGGRIHAWIAAQNMNVVENLITEGETYHVRNFVVRQYGPMQTERCFTNDVYIQLYHMTEFLPTDGVQFIPQHVFHFTELSAIVNAALEGNYLIDVVGVMERVQPIINYRNKYNQQKSSIQFTINDITGTAEVTFHDELAQTFQQQLHGAHQHPIILIISSCKSNFIEGEPKLTNRSATRFFVNHDHDAVEDLRNALSLANWRID